jgi:hypothetical protein
VARIRQNALLWVFMLVIGWVTTITVVIATQP